MNSKSTELNEHIRLDLFKNRLKPAARDILETVIFFMIILFSYIVFSQGVKLVAATRRQVAPVSQISMLIIYLVIPISALFMIIYSAIHIIRKLKGKSKEDKQ